MLITSRPNVRYLTGFTGEGLAIIAPAQTTVITDRRYEQEAAAQLSDCAVIFSTEGYHQEVAQCLASSSAQRLAFEADSLTYATYERLSEHLPAVELVSSRDVVEKRRSAKEPGEVDMIRAAAAIVDTVLPGFFTELSAGVTEKQLALRLREQIVTGGADTLSFEPVVAFASHAAAAHATTTDRPLQPGDTVLIDVGARLDGYCSDITRTICFGPPDACFIRIYQTVRAAQQAALEAIRPGMSGAEADAVAREVITEAGYGEHFGHSLGHGVGLEVHELPRLGKTGDEPLAEGNVVTVEPGIYLSNWGGVRLEDMVVITEDGVDLLTTAPKLDL